MPSRSRITQCPVYSTPERPAIGIPLPCALRRRTPACPAARRRCTASNHSRSQHNPRRQRRVEVRDDLLGLGAGQRVDDVTRRSVGSQRGDDGVLVDTGDDDQRDRFRPGATPFACPVRRTRAPRASSAHVRPLQQRHPLPADDRVAQLVDRMSPQVELLRARLDAAHRRRRSARRPARRAPRRSGSPLTTLISSTACVGGSSIVIVPRVADLGDVGLVVAAHSGMFPCFFGGIWAILRSSSRSAVAT